MVGDDVYAVAESHSDYDASYAQGNEGHLPLYQINRGYGCNHSPDKRHEHIEESILCPETISDYQDNNNEGDADSQHQVFLYTPCGIDAFGGFSADENLHLRANFVKLLGFFLDQADKMGSGLAVHCPESRRYIGNGNGAV